VGRSARENRSRAVQRSNRSTRPSRIQEKHTQMNAINNTEVTNQIDNKAYKRCEARLAPVGPKLEQRLSVIQTPKTKPSTCACTCTRTHANTHTHDSTRSVGPIKMQGGEQANGPLRDRGERMAYGPGTRKEKDGCGR